jgi:hypothetical protein
MENDNLSNSLMEEEKKDIFEAFHFWAVQNYGDSTFRSIFTKAGLAYSEQSRPEEKCHKHDSGHGDIFSRPIRPL